MITVGDLGVSPGYEPPGHVGLVLSVVLHRDELRHPRSDGSEPR